jgi:hypothetical protein
MFTRGQIIFAILFFIAFVGFMIYSYSKDKGLHKLYYKNSSWKSAALIFVVLLFFFSIRYCSHA